MGHALGTAGLVGFATVLLIVMAILIIVAGDRLRNIAGYSAISNLTSANSNLTWAQVFAWIAAGLTLLLLLGYVALHFLETSEWLHLILWILVFAALITSGVFLALALNKINDAKPPNNNGTTGYIWGALITGVVALIVLLISGGWRAAHRQYDQVTDTTYYSPVMTDLTAPFDAAPQPSSIQVNTYPGTVAAPM